MTKEKFKRIIYTFLFVTPLVIGVRSYILDGKSISDALYYSIGLYGFDFEESEAPSMWLEIARWWAPLMTATSVLVIVKSLFSYIHVCISALGRNSNIVYGDSQYALAFCDREKRVVHCEASPVRHGKNHYIMFASDVDNFTFLQNNLTLFRGKNVYVCLNDMEPALLKADFINDIPEKMSLKFFDVNDVFARNFWKEQQIWSGFKTEWKIAIVGFNCLGKKLLERALQLNLFSNTQKIEYYVFGDCKRYKLTHASMELLNKDTIFYYEQNCDEQWKLFATMDMIIVAEEADVNLVQSILGCSTSQTKIYYYSPKNDNISNYIATERLVPYGQNNSVFTLENIRTDSLYKNAHDLNAIYQEKYKGLEWEHLTGFEKESNISASDYGEIIKSLIAKGIDEEELAELEHTRWCRFHFIHYWKYGVPRGGKNRDENEKIHRLLIPYNKLDVENKNKVKEVIRMWRDMKTM